MAETDNRTLSPTPSGYFNAKTAAVGSCMAEIGELEHSIADDKQREEFSKQMHNFHALMQQYISESNAKLDWTQIKSPPEGTVRDWPCQAMAALAPPPQCPPPLLVAAPISAIRILALLGPRLAASASRITTPPPLFLPTASN
eukprot:m.178407 g.178407  ORF g.178407 m.178407 type:complete len:143 (+) comp10449_c4_seq2:330-758(+)